jgi:GT2 family glycosyltransferase
MEAATLGSTGWLGGAVRTLGKLGRFVGDGAAKAATAFRHGRLPASPAWWFAALRLHWRELGGGVHVAPSPARWDREALDASYRRWRAARPGTRRGASSILTARRRETAPLRLSVVACAADARRGAEIADSVRGQPCSGWELCLAAGWDAAAVPPEDARRLAGDPRVRLLPVPAGYGHEAGLRRALGEARGEFVLFLAGGDLLAPAALLHVAEALARDPTLDWLYTDEDRVDADGRHGAPHLKGELGPEGLLGDLAGTRLAVVRRSRIEEVGGLREGFQDAALLDLLLRLVERGARVGHLAEVCCHRRAGAAGEASLPEGIGRSLGAALERRGLRGRPAVPEIAVRLGLDLHGVRWDAACLDAQPVTVVIPTRDRPDLLGACVASLVRTVDARHTRLLVVDDDSAEGATRRHLRNLEASGILGCRVLRVRRERSAFDFARLVNLAVAATETPLVLLLNDDVEATSPGWLAQLAGWFAVPEVGVVGAKLVYPNGAIQHAGVALDARQGLPLHLCHGLDARDAGYALLPHRARNVAAVTGACLLTRTALFRDLGGFDAGRFRVQYGDVDYCLRVRDAGRRVVFEPAAVLVHRGSASRGAAYDYRENLAFLRAHGGRPDPYCSPHLDRGSLCGPSPRLRLP